MYEATTGRIDEVEGALLVLRADGLDDNEIATTVGTTPASIRGVFLALSRRLRLKGDQHARAVAVDVKRSWTSRGTQTVDDVIGDLIDELSG